MVGNLGFYSNNSAELWVLIRGIHLASSLNLNQLIIEGDSQVIISLATNIINGSDPAKVSPRWCLLGLLEIFHALLCPSIQPYVSTIQPPFYLLFF
jgi:ribonuclease HI